MEAAKRQFPGDAGFTTPYQPGNPSKGNVPTVQAAPNYVNANDRRESPLLAHDRHPFDPTAIPTIDVRDYYNRNLDANKNDYNPRKYPDPGLVRTAFPHAPLRPARMNGRTTAFNSPHPAPMPASGTNDVGQIVSRF